jgi:hypothetical protein
MLGSPGFGAVVRVSDQRSECLHSGHCQVDLLWKRSLNGKGITSMANLRDEDLLEKERVLTAEIESLLPDFARSCRENEDVVIIHQDSFAADYQDEEYALFGKAMKFAGIYGKEIRVIGRNRETLTTAKVLFVQ